MSHQHNRKTLERLIIAMFMLLNFNINILYVCFVFHNKPDLPVKLYLMNISQNNFLIFFLLILFIY